MKRRITKTTSTVAAAFLLFAVTTTGAYAFQNQQFLTEAGLTDEQIIAIQEARELRKMGDIAAAQQVLLEADIDLELVAELRQKHRGQHKQWMKVQIAEKLTDEQRDALQVARAANDREAVRAIFEEAGIERPPRDERSDRPYRGERPDRL